MWINIIFCYSNNVSVLLVFQKSNLLHTNKSKWRNTAYATKMYCSSVVFITEVKKTFYVYYYTVLKNVFLKGKQCHYRYSVKPSALFMIYVISHLSYNALSML